MRISSEYPRYLSLYEEIYKNKIKGKDTRDGGEDLSTILFLNGIFLNGTAYFSARQSTYLSSLFLYRKYVN